MASALFVTIAEMIAFARASGVDAALLPAALEGGFGDSKLLQVFGPRMVAQDFTPVGRVATIVKDLRMIEESALEQNLPLPLTALVAHLIKLHMHRGNGELDIASLVKLYARH